jgi:hypothetical protein
MSEKENFDNEDFEKMFTEIVNSDELKDISDHFEKDVKLGLKELLLIQQSLADVQTHIAEILINSIDGGESLVTNGDNIYSTLLSSLYKISEDFNECMIEYYSDFDEDPDEDEGE